MGLICSEENRPRNGNISYDVEDTSHSVPMKVGKSQTSPSFDNSA